MTTKKKSLAGTALVAVAAIAIDGQHFDQGEEVTEVDAEQLRLAVSARRVVTFAEYSGLVGEGESEEGSTDAPAAA